AQIVRVRSTWAQLEATKTALARQNAAAIKQNLERIGIDPRHNAVEVDVSDAAPPSLLTRSQAAASASTVAVEVRRQPSATFDVRPATTCRFPYCDQPLRGGVAIYTSSLRCTSGF